MICKISPDCKETLMSSEGSRRNLVEIDDATWHAVDFGRDTVSTFCNQEKEDHQLEQLNLWR